MLKLVATMEVRETGVIDLLIQPAQKDLTTVERIALHTYGNGWGGAIKESILSDGTEDGTTIRFFSDRFQILTYSKDEAFALRREVVKKFKSHWQRIISENSGWVSEIEREHKREFMISETLVAPC